MQRREQQQRQREADEQKPPFEIEKLDHGQESARGGLQTEHQGPSDKNAGRHQ
jgi:hypothetical protein